MRAWRPRGDGVTRAVPRPRSLVVVLATATALCVSLTAQGVRPGAPLHLAFTPASVNGVSPADLEASMSVWVQALARHRGIVIQATTTIVEDLGDLSRRMAAGHFSLVTMTTEQFWRLDVRSFGTVLVGARRDRVGQEVLLLARADAAGRGLAGLRGASLVALTTGGDAMARPWLEATLLEQGLGEAARHFGTIDLVTKPSRAVLPVFFGQRDACLLTRGAYETMVELNPQVGRALAVVASSPTLQHSVILLDRRHDPAFRPMVLEALLTLHETARGQQVLSLFGRERLVEAAPETLRHTLDVLVRLEKLQKVARR